MGYLVMVSSSLSLSPSLNQQVCFRFYPFLPFFGAKCHISTYTIITSHSGVSNLLPAKISHIIDHIFYCWEKYSNVKGSFSLFNKTE